MGVDFTAGMVVVFALTAAAAVSFAIGWLPAEITALAVAVLLAVLSPWTAVAPADAIAGFSSAATVTVLAMFILSEGVRRTGIVHRLGDRLLPLRARERAMTAGGHHRPRGIGRGARQQHAAGGGADPHGRAAGQAHAKLAAVALLWTV